MNLADILADSAESNGDRVAIKLDDAELPYKFLNAAACGVANLLSERGVEAGDRVGIMLPNVRTSRSSTTASSSWVPSSCR